MSVEIAISNPTLLEDLSQSYSKTICTLNDVKYKLCHEGHLIPKKVNSCIFCNKTHSCPNLGEEKVRNYFENALNAKFPRSFPTWSAYPGSDANPLEYFMLHGYNEKLKIAFIYGEYNKNIVEIKKKMCKEQNIQLVVIPYTKSFSKLKSITRKKIKEIVTELDSSYSNSDSSPEILHNSPEISHVLI
jgi:hypothetical protein